MNILVNNMKTNKEIEKKLEQKTMAVSNFDFDVKTKEKIETEIKVLKWVLGV
jgi:hypothetical protein